MKKPPPKSCIIMDGNWYFFFSAGQTAQNSRELNFRFINSFIQPSLVGSLVLIITMVCVPLNELVGLFFCGKLKTTIFAKNREHSLYAQNGIRLSSYQVFLGYFSFRLQSLYVTLVCLLCISLNLIGQQDSQIQSDSRKC